MNNSVLKEVVRDTGEKLLNPDQNWQPEAVRTYHTPPEGAISIIFTSETPPTRTAGRWFWRNRYLDIPLAFKGFTGHDATIDVDGGYRSVSVFLQQIGPLVREQGIQDSSFSIFIKAVNIFPVYFYDRKTFNLKSRDNHRLWVSIDLYDTQTWADTQHYSRVFGVKVLMEEEAEIGKKLQVLRGKEPQSIAYMRALIESLKEKPWPF